MEHPTQKAKTRKKVGRMSEKPEKPSEDDNILLAAIKNLPDEMRAGILQDYHLTKMARGYYKEMMDAIKSLGLGEDFQGQAIALLPEDPYIIPLSMEDIHEDEDEEDEEDEDGDDRIEPRIIIRDLKKWMKKEGASQAQVADACDVSQGAVSSWLAGQTRPRIANCQAISALIYKDEAGE